MKFIGHTGTGLGICRFLYYERNINFYLVKTTVFGSYLLYAAKPILVGVCDDSTFLVPNIKKGYLGKWTYVLQLLERNISNRRSNCSVVCALVSFTVSVIVYQFLRGSLVLECTEKMV